MGRKVQENEGEFQDPEKRKSTNIQEYLEVLDTLDASTHEM